MTIMNLFSQAQTKKNQPTKKHLVRSVKNFPTTLFWQRNLMNAKKTNVVDTGSSVLLGKVSGCMFR